MVPPSSSEKYLVLGTYFWLLQTRLAIGRTQARGGRRRGETQEEARTQERTDEAFTFNEHLTVVGRKLQLGEAAPDFCLHYLDLVDMAIHTVRLADLAGMVRLLNVVNSLQRPVCQMVTRRWEALGATLPADACVYTVSMDPPQMQARWQDHTGVLHQALSAHHSVQFGQDYGMWLKEWHLLQRAVVVIDRSDRIFYVEYVSDQMREPDYAAAIHAVQKAAGY